MKLTYHHRGVAALTRAGCMTFALAAVAVTGLTQAQGYPIKPIRLAVPQPPGGGNDTIARLIASAPMLVVVHPSVPANSFKSLAKSR